MDMVYGTPAEAAAIYGVGQQTLRRWAKTGKIQFFFTPGGHRRYALPQAAGVAMPVRTKSKQPMAKAEKVRAVQQPEAPVAVESIPEPVVEAVAAPKKRQTAAEAAIAFANAVAAMPALDEPEAAPEPAPRPVRKPKPQQPMAVEKLSIEDLAKRISALAV